MLIEEVRTVSVIESTADEDHITSFNDNMSGNESAEGLFKALAREHSFSEEDIASGIVDWVLEYGDYRLILIHSS